MEACHHAAKSKQEFLKNYDNQASIDEDFGINYRIGTRFTTSGQWTGYMNQINFYNRVLSPDEIKKNFWATRGRYGI